jgi:hypothetical protein
MRLVCLTLLAFCLLVSSSNAKPAHLKALVDYVGPTFPPKLNNCNTCHLPEANDESEKPHNDFGKQLADWRAERKKAKAKNDIPVAMDALADGDADKDGLPNLIEILSGHSPGDLKDLPTMAEKAEAAKQLAALRARRSDYAWTPFEQVQRPAVPQVKNPAWVRNPIDAFIAEQQAKQGLQPRPEATKAVLLRRVYLDLIGLPPTREELQAFLKDTSPQAYEKVVDQLMNSPRYGEAQARHWMDVWRYSDWAGYGAEVRDSKPHIWRWRDWIVESLNADKGYEQMVREMLAGDELAPEDPQTLRATGYLARNWYKFSREVWLDRIVEHTGKAFLGVTLNCARCHDHMYDPFPQTDYYAFRALFATHDIRTDRIPGEADTNKAGVVRVFDNKLDTPTYLFVRGNDAEPDKSKPILAAVPASLTGPTLAIKPVTLSPLAIVPDNRDFVLKEMRLANEAAIRTAAQQGAGYRARLGVALLGTSPWAVLGRLPVQAAREEQLTQSKVDEQIAALQLKLFDAFMLVEKLDAKAHAEEWKKAATETNKLQRDLALFEARKKLSQAKLLTWKPVAKGQSKPTNAVPEAEKGLAKAESDLKLPPATTFTPRKVTSYPATSSGRRLALANWIASSQNPLTARVAMNHLWMRRFGTAIVPSVFEFGKNGQAPTHPKLLDWLASEMVAQKWSLKQMHRLMVTSATYRMASGFDASMAARDPDNRFLWRQNVRRMTAESVRDSVLYLTNDLDPAMGGPEIDQTTGMTSQRRSLYFRHAPEKQMTFLEVFDAASPVECYRRSESVVPQQALALANSPLTQAKSRVLARQLTEQFADREKFIDMAFETILCRPATEQERELCHRFLNEQPSLLSSKGLTPAGGTPSTVPPAKDPAQRARENLIHVLLNHNDFVSVR